MFALFIAALYVGINAILGNDLGVSTVESAYYLKFWYGLWVVIVGLFGLIGIIISILGIWVDNGAWAIGLLASPLIAALLAARNVMAIVACWLVETSYTEINGIGNWSASRLTVAAILGIIFVVTRIKWSTTNKD